MKFRRFRYCLIAMTATVIIFLLVMKSPLMGTQQEQLFLYPTEINKQRLKQKSPWKSMTLRDSHYSTLPTEYTVQPDAVKVHREVTDVFNVTVLASENKWKRVERLAKQEQKETGWKMVNRMSQTQIFSAYIDDRDKQLNVIIIGLQDHTQARTLHYYCVLKYPNETEVCLEEPATQTTINRGDELEDKIVWGYSFTCKIGSSTRAIVNQHSMEIPLFIGLSIDKSCTSSETSWLPISAKSIDNKDFGVCIETPVFRSNYWEMPARFVVEGIERNRALGADWITVYVQDTTEDIMKVLKDYEKEGILEIVNWNLSKEAVQHSHYYAESVSIADCLYRNMYRVKYLAFVDLDEIIVPQNHTNWSDMIAAVDQTNLAAFQFSHTVLLRKHNQRELPMENWVCIIRGKGTKIFRHSPPSYLTQTCRTPPYPFLKRHKSFRQKVIVKPALMKYLGIHNARSFVKPSGLYSQLKVPHEIALLYHYRTPPLCRDCMRFTKEDHRLRDIVPSLFDTIRERLCRYLH